MPTHLLLSQVSFSVLITILFLFCLFLCSLTDYFYIYYYYCLQGMHWYQEQTVLFSLYNNSLIQQKDINLCKVP